MDPAAAAETTEPLAEPDGFAAARAAMDQAVRVVEAAFALLRAELRLARSSALMLIWLSFALVFLGVGAWLATSAAIAAGIYQLTGNVFYGVGCVALANLVGVTVVLLAMRGCWRDLALPRTRRAFLRMGRGNE
ncbi:MAG: hypothetical protein ABIW82_09180 [Dokdonella sp.]